jgi:4-amino-4-deoxy-L-arabinose transferase-like glycosyltransferase
LSVSAFKHHHYLMAALPALSLILGRTLADVVAEVRAGRPVFTTRQAVVWSAAVLAVAITAPIVVTRKWPHLEAPALAIGLLLGLGGIATIAFSYRRRFRPALVISAVTFGACYALVVGRIFPGRDHRLPIARFAREVNADLSTNARLCVFGLQEDPVVYYLPASAYRIEDERRFQRQLEREDRLMVVTDETKLAALNANARGRVLRTVSTYPDCSPAKGPRLVLVEVRPATFDVRSAGAHEERESSIR